MAYTLSDDLAERLTTYAEQLGWTVEDLLRGWLASDGSIALAHQQHFRTLVEHSPDPVARIDRNLRHTYVNPALVRATGIAFSDYIGKTTRELPFSSEFSAFLDAQVQKVLDTGQPNKTQFDFATPAGRRYFEVHLTPEFGADETVESVLAIARDITDHEALTRRMHESEARYRAIVESQIDLICRYTPDAVLTYVNDAYAQFFGKTRDELEGTSFLLLSPSSQHTSIRERIANILMHPSPGVAEYRSVVPGGEERWIQWVDHGILDEAGQVIEIQAVGRDITELKRLEDERVRTAAIEAELAAERELRVVKDQFISMVSHEFRAPLSVIKASTEMMQQYEDRMTPERKQEHLVSINEQVDQMTALLTDVLLLDRARAGMMTLQPEKLDVVALCRSVVEHFILADSHQHQFIFDAPDDRLEAVVDARSLNRILGNLLANAIKYSPAGSLVRLKIGIDGGRLLFSVQDEGIGIPEEDQSHIFETFFRARNAYGFEGTGLGLAIVRQYVELHGGLVDFESQTGQGTTFSIRLPFKNA